MAKTLIIYYSNTGGTVSVAKVMAKQLQAETFEIKPVKTYDKNMWTAWDVAKAERDNQQLPKLKATLLDITPYDNIIIGTPVWGYTMANPIMTLLNQLDFQGKNIYGFWTFYDHDEQMIADFKRYIHNGHFIKGLPITQSNLHDSNRLDTLIADFVASIN